MDLAKEVQDVLVLVEHDPEAALSALESLYGKAMDSDDARALLCSHHLALVYYQTGKYAVAYEHATVAADHYRALGDPVNEALMLNVLGGVYYYIGDNENRLACNKRGLELTRDAGDMKGLLRAMNNTADTYTQMGMYNEAMTLFNECLKLATAGHERIRCIVLSNMAEIHLLNGNYDEVPALLEQSQALVEPTGYTEIGVVNTIMRAKLDLRADRSYAALLRLQQLAKEMTDATTLREQATVYELLAKANEDVGDLKEALLCQRVFVSIQQQHLNEQKIREIRALEFKQELQVLQTSKQALEKMVQERTAELNQTLETLKRREQEKQWDLEVEQAVNVFSTSLMLQETEEDALWDVIRNCISKLKFEDAVIYLLDRERNVLVQKAAYGPKNPENEDILNPIEIPVGKGIVGHVAQTGVSELIADTSADSRYILDDAPRLSEITIPIKDEDGVIGIIDSEHHQKDFYNHRHVRVLETIAALVANRLSRIRIKKEREQLQEQLIGQLKQNEQLQTKVNRELEQRVAERTAQILEAKDRIQAQNESIEESIRYAGLIQTSLLPAQENLKRLFPDHLLFYRPRDIVSGDFYWAAEKDGARYLAVADCTGHGVPGALLSVLCIEKLNQALQVESSPDAMLHWVNREIWKTLKKSDGKTDGITLLDGMDIALMRLDGHTSTVTFAGAMHSMYLVRNGELQKYRGDRLSIGGFNDARSFSLHTVECHTGDMFYFMSDGFTDQFGGADNRKYTSRRLQQFLATTADQDVQQQLHALISEFETHMGQQPQVDDVLLVGVRI
jgi:serine phosphatase RsbU (regulator of sigma subunit)